MIVMLVVGLWSTYADFKENPILTTFKIEQNSEGMLFPEIIVCPPYPINETRLKNMHDDHFNVLDRWDKAFVAAGADIGLLMSMTHEQTTLQTP